MERINLTYSYSDSISHFSHIPLAGYKGTYSLAPLEQNRSPIELLEKALKKPVGVSEENFFNLNLKDKRVLIVLSDSFRHTGVEQILQSIVEKIIDRHCSVEHINFIIAVGAHRPPTEQELRKILSPTLYEKFKNKIIIPNPEQLDDYVFLGNTQRNTPIYIHKSIMDFDYLLVTGTVMFHYFAGFGGGRKSIVPGLAGLPTIKHNHALSLHPEKPTLHPNVSIGKLQGNPVAEDLLESVLHLDKKIYILNTVLDPNEQILNIFYGDLIHAHLTATNYAQQTYTVPIQEPADIVIASAYPAKNLLQSHKALINAWEARSQPHGKIILIAPCVEGLGGKGFQEQLEKGDPQKIAEHTRRFGEINGQTAISILQKSKYTFYLTELSHETIEMIGGKKIQTLEEGFYLASEELRKEGITSPRWIYLPDALYTVPTIAKQ